MSTERTLGIGDYKNDDSYHYPGHVDDNDIEEKW